MFIYEAIELSGIMDVQIILADCDDATRVARLTNYRMQPELADENMMGWARYLREEASGLRCEILDTGALPLAQCVERIRRSLRASQLAQREHCY
jgi:hypothetical protein